MNRSTHSCLEIPWNIDVWNYSSFENNFGIKLNFTKYLKGSCGLGFDQHFLFKFFFEKYSGYEDITVIVLALLAATGMNGLGITQDQKILFKMIGIYIPNHL